jgi:hypothetical protein
VTLLSREQNSARTVRTVRRAVDDAFSRQTLQGLSLSLSFAAALPSSRRRPTCRLSTRFSHSGSWWKGSR